ncbi:MAG: YggS family pyridoxal phosphate-dependent enzyme [Acidimicrobiia bacterium]|nr:YggS family pyridoxal phosphate-dependent enzyme [Acidimicrobiia bacterium]
MTTQEDEAAVQLLAENLDEVRSRISDAARLSSRSMSGIRLVGISKTIDAATLALALDLGLCDFGENRAQELLEKAPLLAVHDPAPVWHFVGQLQRNKVAAISPHISLWHSVDRALLGEAIAKRAPGARVLVEVNLAEEPQRGGVAPSGCAELVDGLRSLGLDVAGLMTVAPQIGEPSRWFEALRILADELGVVELSMGMSSDYEAAIAQGSTILRVGASIFGGRRAI